MSIHLTIQVPRNGTPQLPAPFAGDINEVLEIIAGREAHTADKVLCGCLDVAVVAALESRHVVLWAPEVRVR
jgi:hypothetical protein